MPNVTDWQYLNLNYVTKAQIDQDACIKCGRCYAACEDTSHQAISMTPDRVFEVKDDECVACNLCVNVCPVENCITMVPMAKGAVDPAHRAQGRRLRQLDDASEQPERRGRVSGLQPALDRINEMLSSTPTPVVVALDGRSGVGKSTLATAIADRLGAVVIEGDDFYAGGVGILGDSPECRADVASTGRLSAGS